MQNLENIRLQLVAEKLDAFLTSNISNVFWLTGFSGSFGMSIVSVESGVLISDSRYAIQASAQCRILDVETYANPTKVVDFLHYHLKKLNIRRLGIDKNHVTLAVVDDWQKVFPEIELVALEDPIDTLRQIKSPAELSRIRESCRITDDCLHQLMRLLKPGVTERQLQWAFEDMLRGMNATAAFAPIILSGPNTAYPHGAPSTRPICEGDFITFDIGARQAGYCSDITRTVVLGAPSDRQRECYDHLLKAQIASIEAMKPGAKGRDVDALARSILAEKNLAQHFGHGLGHGLGALVHDTGRLAPSSDQTISVGQVWTIEPGIYIEGEFGIRIEDDVVITENGCEVLTTFPKTLVEIPWGE